MVNGLQESRFGEYLELLGTHKEKGSYHYYNLRSGLVIREWLSVGAWRCVRSSVGNRHRPVTITKACGLN